MLNIVVTFLAVVNSISVCVVILGLHQPSLSPSPSPVDELSSSSASTGMSIEEVADEDDAVNDMDIDDPPSAAGSNKRKLPVRRKGKAAAARRSSARVRASPSKNDAKDEKQEEVKDELKEEVRLETDSMADLDIPVSDAERDALQRLLYMNEFELSKQAGFDNIVLHDYQCQTLKWCLLQEHKYVNSALFKRLHFRGQDSHIQFFYSPYLQRFVFSPLPAVSGGWIVEEMG